MFRKFLILFGTILMLYANVLAQTRQDIVARTISEVKQIESFLVDEEKSIADIAFSPDQKLLAVAEIERSPDLAGTVRLWDISTHEELSSAIYTQLNAITIAFSPDGKWFAAAGNSGEVTIVDTEASEVIHQFALNTNDINELAFSPDGKSIAIASGLFGGVDPEKSGQYAFSLINAENGTELFSWLRNDKTYGGTGLSVAFSPDGKLVAFGQTLKYIQLWDIETRSQVKVLTMDSSDGVFSLAFSPNGDLLAAGNVRGEVTLWDTLEWEKAGVFEGGMQWHSDIVFSPDGSLIATTGNDGNIHIFDTKTQEEVTLLKGHTASLISLAFSPDGTLLASGGTDGTVRLWGVPVDS
jgi:WD40 repeat protein